MHLTPAGLPSGIPGMGDEMEGAMQHAPQEVLQFMTAKLIKKAPRKGSVETVAG